MPIALAIFAIFVILASGSAVFFPTELLSMVSDVMRGPGWWSAAVARLVLAVVLWFSAPASHTPKTFRVLAVITLVAALFIVIVGPESILELVDWLVSWPTWVVRLQATLGVAFGVFLLWSISRKWTSV